MGKASLRIYVGALLLALVVNFGLFALIPQLAQQQEDRCEPLRRQRVSWFREPLPETLAEEQPPPPEEKKPPPPTPKPVSQALPRLLQAPDLALAPPEPALQLTTGCAVAPLAPLAGSYQLEDLDRAPVLSYQAPPLYPYRAKRLNISGKVKIAFEVGVDGQVGAIRIIESEPPGIFDEAVLTAVRQWRFHPGELLGDKVATRMSRTIVFNLEE